MGSMESLLTLERHAPPGKSATEVRHLFTLLCAVSVVPCATCIMRAIRPAARCAPPRAPTRLLATGASKGRKPSGAAPAAGARRGQAPQMPYATPNSAASPIPMPTLPVRSPGDELMARFSQNTEKEDPLPLVSSREEFGKRYLFELITMPIRTPGASFQVRDLIRLVS